MLSIPVNRYISKDIIVHSSSVIIISPSCSPLSFKYMHLSVLRFDRPLYVYTWDNSTLNIGVICFPKHSNQTYTCLCLIFVLYWHNGASANSERNLVFQRNIWYTISASKLSISTPFSLLHTAVIPLNVQSLNLVSNLLGVKSEWYAHHLRNTNPLMTFFRISRANLTNWLSIVFTFFCKLLSAKIACMGMEHSLSLSII